MKEKLLLLREKAEKTRIKDWKVSNFANSPCIVAIQDENGYQRGYEIAKMSCAGRIEDLEFMACADPVTVLTLLDYIGELEERLAEIPEDSEERVKWALRNHAGGLGQSLSEEEKRRIQNGRADISENTSPINEEKMLESFRESIRNMDEIIGRT